MIPWLSSQRLRIALLVVLQVLVLLAMVGGYAFDMARGKEITVETAPVDPRSLFRGNYVRLNYTFSVLSARLAGDTCFQEGQTVYVTLSRDGGAEGWLPKAVSTRPPSTQPPSTQPPSGNAPDAVTLWGQVTSGFACKPDGSGPRAAQDENGNRTGVDLLFRVDYGISAYFAAPEAALALERMVREGDRVRVILSVPPSGRALIKGLEINGERHIDSLFW